MRILNRVRIGFLTFFIVLWSVFPNAVFAVGEPIAHWRFDEGSGTQVRNSIAGTATGSFLTPNPTWSTDVPSVSFTNPYSLTFSSIGDGVSFAWPSALNFTGTEERSFSFWYKPLADGETASGNYDRIMSWDGDDFEISGTYGNVAVHRLAFYDGSWRDTGFDLTVGTWYNIMFTYDGTNVKLYVAGDEKFSGTSGGRDINGTMYIGVRYTGDEGINGRIDDVRIYDYALTPSQVQNIVSGSDNPSSSPPPTLSGALVPADNATNINGSANLVMTFNRTVQGGTGSIIIKKSSDDSTVETISASGSKVTGSGTRILTINPSTTLSDSTSYYVVVQPNAVRSGSGAFYAGLSGTGSWNFTTGDFTAPSISSLSPADNATGVSTTANLVLTFDQVTRAGTGALTIKKSSDNSTVESITVSGALLSGNGSTELTLNPSTTLTEGTSYYVVWGANTFKDSTSNHSAAVTSSSTWNFTTAEAAASSSSSSSTAQQVSGGGRGHMASEGGTPPVLTGPRSVSPVTTSSTPDMPSEPVRVRTSDGIEQVVRDVRTNDWFAEHVKRVMELRIFEGYKDMNGSPLGLYGPADNITMGQLAKVGTLLAKRLVIEVHGNDWAYPYVAAVKSLKLKTFEDAVQVDASATRAEVIQTVLESLRIPVEGTPSKYSDVPADHDYAAAIATATKMGIVSGDDNKDTFRPDDPVNRAEVAKMIVQALSKAK